MSAKALGAPSWSVPQAVPAVPLFCWASLEKMVPLLLQAPVPPMGGWQWVPGHEGGGRHCL